MQIKCCDKCQRTNAKLQKGHQPLHPVPVKDEAWCQVGIGPLPETPRGHKYIMTMTDYFTKWVEASPLKDKSASSVADVLYSVSIIKFIINLCYLLYYRQCVAWAVQKP